MNLTVFPNMQDLAEKGRFKVKVAVAHPTPFSLFLFLSPPFFLSFSFSLFLSGDKVICSETLAYSLAPHQLSRIHQRVEGEKKSARSTFGGLQGQRERLTAA